MISFEVKDESGECTDIYNPFISECGRFKTNPSEYGFRPEDAGSGMPEGTLVLRLDHGALVLLVPKDGAAALSAENALMLYIDEQGNELVRHDPPDDEQIAALQSRKYLVSFGCGAVEIGAKILYAFELEAHGFDKADYFAILATHDHRIWHNGTSVMVTPMADDFTPRYKVAHPEYDDLLPDLWPLVDTTLEHNEVVSFGHPAQAIKDYALLCDYKAPQLRDSHHSCDPDNKKPRARFEIVRCDGQDVRVLVAGHSWEALIDGIVKWQEQNGQPLCIFQSVGHIVANFMQDHQQNAARRGSAGG